MAVDHLCQEMRDACLGELRVAGFPSFTVFTVPEKVSCGTLRSKASLSPWTGCDLKGEGCGERK